MTTDEFDLELGNRLVRYAALAAGDPTTREVEAAVAARPRGLDRLFIPLHLRWALVGIVLLLVAMAAAAIVGALQDGRPGPFDPRGSLTIAAGAIDGGVEVWDARSARWVSRANGSLRQISPDGRWIVVSDASPSARGYVLLDSAAEQGGRPRIIWGGVPQADGSTSYPRVLWSPHSDWVARVAGGALELVAVDPDLATRRIDLSSAPIEGLAWWQPEGTLGWIAGTAPDGTIRIIDVDARTEVAVRNAAFAYDSSTDEPPTLQWAGDRRLAVIGRDGNLWIVAASGSAEPLVTALTSDGSLQRSDLWGWSADSQRVGAAWTLFDPSSGTRSSLGHADGGCSSRPAWGPMGHDLAFVSNGQLSIVRSNATIKGQSGTVCSPPETLLRYPLVWSPDSHWIAIPVAREDVDRWPAGLRLFAHDVQTDETILLAEDPRSGINYQIGWRSPP